MPHRIIQVDALKWCIVRGRMISIVICDRPPALLTFDMTRAVRFIRRTRVYPLCIYKFATDRACVRVAGIDFDVYISSKSRVAFGCVTSQRFVVSLVRVRFVYY